jgi:hypothetical protein
VSEPHQISLSQPKAWTRERREETLRWSRTFRTTEGLQKARIVNLVVSSTAEIAIVRFNGHTLSCTLETYGSFNIKPLLQGVNRMELEIRSVSELSVPFAILEVVE